MAEWMDFTIPDKLFDIRYYRARAFNELYKARGRIANDAPYQPENQKPQNC